MKIPKAQFGLTEVSKIGSDIDFAGRYIKQFLGFLGISDIEFVKLDQLMFESDAKIEKANQKIAAII